MNDADFMDLCLNEMGRQARWLGMAMLTALLRPELPLPNGSAYQFDEADGLDPEESE